MNDSYSDRDNIILTSDQWELTANQYMVINRGVLCVEIKPDGEMFIKVGVGDKYYKDLPYIHGENNEIDLSAYAKITYVDDKISSINIDLDKLKSLAHSHSNIDILNEITAPFTKEEKDKLLSIEENANNYKLPIASQTQLGGIKVGSKLVIDPDGTLSVDADALSMPDVMVGATHDTDGKSGLVPTPLAGDEDKFLKGDGTFAGIDVLTYNDFVGAEFPYEVVDPDTGEITIIPGDGKSGLVPAPPPRDETLEDMYGYMYLRYDGTWASIPETDVFIGVHQIYDEGKAGLVPAPVVGDVGKFLSSNGEWQSITDAGGYTAKEITDGFPMSFRSQILGMTLPKDFLSVVQSETDMVFAPQDGVGIALGANESNGYIYMDPMSEKAFIGGGSKNALNWIKQISFTDHTHPIDDVLSDTSENPVQNKVITNEINSINDKIDELAKINFSSKSEFPETGDTNILYIDISGNEIYRWDSESNVYIALSSGGGGSADGDKTFDFEQAVPSAEWYITHNLNKFPSVTVVDTAGTNIVGDISYIDKNNLAIYFSASFSGKAFLN